LLDYPVRCPHGNIIPGLAELGVPTDASKRALAAGRERAVAMTMIASRRAEPVVVRRISEQVQSDAELMLKLKSIGIQPGREITLAASDDGVRVIGEDGIGGLEAELPRQVAAHVFVTKP
jgi:DtxR family transcriptional regulator, Mn-dependent transcriptional regulator